MTPALSFRVIHKRNALLSMDMYFFGSVLAWFREVGISKRRTQAVYLSAKAYREVHWFETAL
ncbi:MAG: hypothetical protein R6T98_11895 [Desulfatiglandales bacterium]